MKVLELRHTVALFAQFANTLSDGSGGELETLVSILPASDKETTAAFVKRLKGNLENGSSAAPLSFTQQWDSLKTLLASLGVKKAVCDDFSLISTLWASSPSASLDAFANRLVAARDYIPPAKVRNANGSSKKKPSAKQIATDYVEKLKQAALKPFEFGIVLKELQSNTSLKDSTIKEIANELNSYHGKSPERPKTREEAFQRILGYQHKKAGSEFARRALELTPP